MEHEAWQYFAETVTLRQTAAEREARAPRSSAGNWRHARRPKRFNVLGLCPPCNKLQFATAMRASSCSTSRRRDECADRQATGGMQSRRDSTTSVPLHADSRTSPDMGPARTVSTQGIRYGQVHASATRFSQHPSQRAQQSLEALGRLDRVLGPYCNGWTEQRGGPDTATSLREVHLGERYSSECPHQR